MFRPVFRKKEDRKLLNSKKTTKASFSRPASSGVKIVFDYDDESKSLDYVERKKSKRKEKKQKINSGSDDDWVEAPQQPFSRPKASDFL